MVWVFFSDVVSKRTKVAHQVLNDAKHRTREFHDCVRTLVTEKMVFFMKKFYQPAREILRKKSVTKSFKIWTENAEFRTSGVKKQQLDPVRFSIFFAWVKMCFVACFDLAVRLKQEFEKISKEKAKITFESLPASIDSANFSYKNNFLYIWSKNIVCKPYRVHASPPWTWFWAFLSFQFLGNFEIGSKNNILSFQVCQAYFFSHVTFSKKGAMQTHHGW